MTSKKSDLGGDDTKSDEFQVFPKPNAKGKTNKVDKLTEMFQKLSVYDAPSFTPAQVAAGTPDDYPLVKWIGDSAQGARALSGAFRNISGDGGLAVRYFTAESRNGVFMPPNTALEVLGSGELLADPDSIDAISAIGLSRLASDLKPSFKQSSGDFLSGLHLLAIHGLPANQIAPSALYNILSVEDCNVWDTVADEAITHTGVSFDRSSNTFGVSSYPRWSRLKAMNPGTLYDKIILLMIVYGVYGQDTKATAWKVFVQSQPSIPDIIKDVCNDIWGKCVDILQASVKKKALLNPKAPPKSGNENLGGGSGGEGPSGGSSSGGSSGGEGGESSTSGSSGSSTGGSGSSSTGGSGGGSTGGSGGSSTGGSGSSTAGSGGGGSGASSSGSSAGSTTGGGLGGTGDASGTFK